MGKCHRLGLVMLCLFPLGAVAQTQNCAPNKAETTPTSRFIDQGDGTVKDKQTNKIWLRCAVGMHWNGQSCEDNSTTHNYNEALRVVDEYNNQHYAKRTNWRLPTSAELSALIEQRCTNPAINLDVFPYSPQSGFWTSSEDIGSVATRIEVVHFLNGGVYVASKSQAWRVRLIAD